MKIISIDPGLYGCISVFNEGVLVHIADMPLNKICVRPPTTKFKHTDPKIVFKSGPSKGQRQRIQTNPGKYRNIIDFDKVIEGITSMAPDTIVIETQYALTYRAKSTYQNYGALLGICYSAVGYNNTVEIHPSNWKRALGLQNMPKEASIPLAQSYYPHVTFSSHDRADAALIGYYYINQPEVTNK